MSLEGRQVVVAGGAVGGMAAALLLARAGASVTVLERVAEPTAVGAGLLLQPIRVPDAGRVTGDLVVGADGVGSVVRQGGDFGARTRPGATCLRGLVARDDLGPEGEWWTPLGLLGGAPMGDGTTYFYGSATRRRWRPPCPWPAGSWSGSRTRRSCWSTRSCGSTASAGTTAGWCWSATPPTPWPRPSGRGPTAPWSTRPCSPPSWPAAVRRVQDTADRVAVRRLSRR